MRVSTLFYLPVMILLILMVLEAKEDRIKAILSFLAGLMILLLLVVLVHSSTIGNISFQAIYTHDSYPFLSGTNIMHSGQWNQEDADLYFSWPADTRDALARKEAINRIKTDIFDFFRIIIAKISILFRDNTYGSRRSLSVLDKSRIPILPERWALYFEHLNNALSQALYVTIWGLGIFTFRKQKMDLTAYLALGMVLFTILPHTILEVQARYHHYIMPYLIVAASSGFIYLRSKDLVCEDES